MKARDIINWDMSEMIAEATQAHTHIYVYIYIYINIYMYVLSMEPDLTDQVIEWQPARVVAQISCKP